jgi:hypothetical protein
MSWVPSSLGAEPKKVAILVGLLALAGGVYWSNREPEVAVTTAPRAAAPAQAIPTPASVNGPRPARSSQPKQKARGGNDDFHPSLKFPEDFDLSKVDPTLRTELLAKVREVGDVGGSRSLFEFYVPPPPPPPKVDPIKVDFQKEREAAERAAAAAKPASNDPPKPPPPPPIPLKYYGYEGQPKAGKLKAFFQDGDEIFAKGAGDTIRNRYHIVRIGPTSAEVEDTVAKNTQTLRILERCEDSPSCK